MDLGHMICQTSFDTLLSEMSKRFGAAGGVGLGLMFESDFADIRVSLILAILLMKKSLQRASKFDIAWTMKYIVFFLCKMYFILSHNFLGFVMFSETKFVFV